MGLSSTMEPLAIAVSFSLPFLAPEIWLAFKKYPAALDRSRERNPSWRTQPGSVQGLASRWHLPPADTEGGWVNWVRIQFSGPLTFWMGASTMHRRHRQTCWMTTFGPPYPESPEPKSGINPTRKPSLMLPDTHTWVCYHPFHFLEPHTWFWCRGYHTRSWLQSSFTPGRRALG